MQIAAINVRSSESGTAEQDKNAYDCLSAKK